MEQTGKGTHSTGVRKIPFGGDGIIYMLVVAQLGEHQIVTLGVAGSSPVFQPKMLACSSGLRGRSAKALFIGSNPIANSITQSGLDA